jgi:Lon protease-like protein
MKHGFNTEKTKHNHKRLVVSVSVFDPCFIRGDAYRAMNEALHDFQDFNGVARLFPLPNVVLFPHVVQPFHIFEPRYRQLTKDAVESDRLVAVVLLKPGFEEEYEGRPPIHDVACLGRIVADQPLPDGKYNLLVRGLCRLRLDQEAIDDKPYRSAGGWPLPDPMHADDQELRKELVQAVLDWLPPGAAYTDQFKQLLHSPIPLGALADVLGFMLPLAVELKQALLEELDIDSRARRLLGELRSSSPPEVLPPPRRFKYPPAYSSN